MDGPQTIIKDHFFGHETLWLFACLVTVTEVWHTLDGGPSTFRVFKNPLANSDIRLAIQMATNGETHPLLSDTKFRGGVMELELFCRSLGIRATPELLLLPRNPSEALPKDFKVLNIEMLYYLSYYTT